MYVPPIRVYVCLHAIWRYAERALGMRVNRKRLTDALAIEKLKLAGADIYDAAVHDCGAIKYDPYNWREVPIYASVYIAAIERHLGAYKAGQTMDDGHLGSGLPHMAMIRANAAILIDAEHMGVLTDDRPKTPGYEKFAIALAGRKAVWMEEERARRAALEEPYNEWLSPT